jgi:hypothetical protein
MIQYMTYSISEGLMSVKIINGNVFRPVNIISDDTGFYLAVGLMELDGVDEECVVQRWRGEGWIVEYKYEENTNDRA